jgi:hypothetical protein
MTRLLLAHRPEQALGFCERVSIAACGRRWFLTGLKGAVPAERLFRRVFNYG